MSTNPLNGYESLAMAKKASKKKQYWLFKSEPNSYSIDDLEKDKNQTTCWDGVRNYQARNLLRDDIKVGDQVFFYHSNAKPMAIVGTAEVVKAGYPDHTAFDKNDHHYDEKSDPENPRWYMVDIKLIQKFEKPVTREELKAEEKIADMMLLQRGSRLSVQPVTAAHWKHIHKLAGAKA
ncbi:EVE domain protein [Thalassoglobus polymorphus]|uniref:EVE domain protein n=2 Tax=Thalassoglobus polymorphus TaxID=2527994 RepID=A0A517QIM3_9PLAN|nr:EVE domain-containing protein [Thalassoglobus polymorphus]QDT31435.1 EVE domain protein [Thalassoglobus polymorphus]